MLSISTYHNWFSTYIKSLWHIHHLLPGGFWEDFIISCYANILKLIYITYNTAGGKLLRCLLEYWTYLLYIFIWIVSHMHAWFKPCVYLRIDLNFFSVHEEINEKKCGTQCILRSGLRKGVYHIFEFISNEPNKKLWSILIN